MSKLDRIFLVASLPAGAVIGCLLALADRRAHEGTASQAAALEVLP